MNDLAEKIIDCLINLGYKTVVLNDTDSKYILFYNYSSIWVYGVCIDKTENWQYVDIGILQDNLSGKLTLQCVTAVSLKSFTVDLFKEKIKMAVNEFDRQIQEVNEPYPYSTQSEAVEIFAASHSLIIS